MRAMSTLVVLLLASLALAGCSEGPSPSNGDEDQGLDDLDLKAGDDTGIIRGIVVDASITPVVGAMVSIKGQEIGTESNDRGAFGFSDLEPGSYFLTIDKPGFVSAQTNVEVQAGVAEPPILKVLLEAEPSTAPFIQDMFFRGYLTCGAAVFATSVGCTTIQEMAEAIGDQSIFPVDYDRVPHWVQAELIWEATQPAAGAFIWEITPQGSNTHIGYRETTTSPALAYLNSTVAEANGGKILGDGLNLRFFGGPHELCKIPMDPPPGLPVGWRFGCGLTLEQEAEVFAHNFYNFVPGDGWRFTVDGAHPVPI